LVIRKLGLAADHDDVGIDVLILPEADTLVRGEHVARAELTI